MGYGGCVCHDDGKAILYFKTGLDPVIILKEVLRAIGVPVEVRQMTPKQLEVLHKIPSAAYRTIIK